MSVRSRGRWQGLVIGLVVVCGTGRARADPLVLHEFVLPPTRRGAAACEGAICGAGGAGQNPKAIRVGTSLLPAPGGAAQPSLDERDPGEVEADRRTEAAPDRSTQADGVLTYSEVFNPSVVPFKRTSSLDRVTPDYRLVASNRGPHRVVPVLGTPQGVRNTPGRELFWGSLVVDVAPDREAALPSVSPEARILSYRTQPEVALQFLRDSSDNFYVRGSRAQRTRITFLTDAPSTYFAGSLPPGVRLDEVPAALVPQLPPRVRADAMDVARALDVGRHLPVATLLDRLVGHFRSFTPGSPPVDTGNIYRDLALGKRGVCRHRAFAFVITAQALGLPARYVTNEAHAFSEVFVPRVGWRRVDLGGGALRLDVKNASDKELHQPVGEDPFPKPPNYAQNYTLLNGSVTGLSARAAAAAGARSGAKSGGAQSGAAQSGAAEPGAQAQRGKTGGQVRDGGAAGTTMGDGAAGTAGQGTAPPQGPASEPNPDAPDEPGSRPPEAPPRTPTSIALDRHATSGFRGEDLIVEGRVLAAGQGVEGLRVEVFLTPDASQQGILVGPTATGPGGHFRARFAIPVDVNLGNHFLVVTTPGDRRFAPSRSQ